MISRNCEYCGKSFDVWPYQLAKGEGQFCSLRCVRRAHIKPRTQEEFKEQFWRQVAIGDPHRCWEWQGKSMTKAGGYGLMWVPGIRKLVSANRIAWEISNGPISPGLVIRHKCDNPPCCNPAHLILGTTSDNAKDMVSRNRQNPANLAALLDWTRRNGKRPINATLTAKEAEIIRQLYAAGRITQGALAKQFGVTQSNISRIINRGRWK